MKSTSFEEQTKVLERPKNMTEEECKSLPIWNGDGSQCISRWELNDDELALVMDTKAIWCSVLSGQTQPPIWLSADRPFENSKGEIADEYKPHRLDETKEYRGVIENDVEIQMNFFQKMGFLFGIKPKLKIINFCKFPVEVVNTRINLVTGKRMSSQNLAKNG